MDGFFTFSNLNNHLSIYIPLYPSSVYLFVYLCACVHMYGWMAGGMADPSKYICVSTYLRIYIAM